MKSIRILLMLLTVSAASPAWARSPRSREFCGNVEAVGTSSSTLTVTQSSGKNLTAVWTKDTVFIHDGKGSDAAALSGARTVCAYYRTPLIGPAYLTKVVW